MFIRKEASVLETRHVHDHEQTIRAVEPQMPDDGELLDMAELFRVFGDGTRIKILYMLSRSEMCVCDIAGLAKMGQPAVSHHLRVLRQAKLIKSRRDGKNILYSLADDHVQTIVNMGIEHIREQ